MSDFAPTAIESDRTLCIVVHDVAAPTLEPALRLLGAIRDVAGDAPLTWLAVPRYHGHESTATFDTWLGDRVRGGDELALHGHTHLDDSLPELDPNGGAQRLNGIDALRRRHYTRGEGEFAALSKEDALARIDAGVAWFAKHGWPLRGFVAPAWLLGDGAWAALAERSFEYTSTLGRLYHLPSRRPVASQSVVYSTSRAWRRQVSLLWTRAVAMAERSNPLLRLELHPHDADHAAIRRSWQRILADALVDRKPSTVADFMAQDRRAHPDSREVRFYGEQASAESPPP